MPPFPLIGCEYGNLSGEYLFGNERLRNDHRARNVVLNWTVNTLNFSMANSSTNSVLYQIASDLNKKLFKSTILNNLIWFVDFKYFTLIRIYEFNFVCWFKIKYFHLNYSNYRKSTHTVEWADGTEILVWTRTFYTFPQTCYIFLKNVICELRFGFLNQMNKIFYFKSNKFSASSTRVQITCTAQCHWIHLSYDLAATYHNERLSHAQSNLHQLLESLLSWPNLTNTVGQHSEYAQLKQNQKKNHINQITCLFFDKFLLEVQRRVDFLQS